MTRIPNNRGVDRALHSLRVELRTALKGVDRTAGQIMAKGDYAGAEALAGKGREVREFTTQVEELRKRWRAVSGRGSSDGKKLSSTRTPLWTYYQPILRALRDAGGEARRTDLESLVERILAATLQPADRDQMSGGRERWKVMIHRARRHLVAEGWIEDRSGATWHITAAGRKAAEQPSTGAIGAP